MVLRAYAHKYAVGAVCILDLYNGGQGHKYEEYNKREVLIERKIKKKGYFRQVSIDGELKKKCVYEDSYRVELIYMGEEGLKRTEDRHDLSFEERLILSKPSPIDNLTQEERFIIVSESELLLKPGSEIGLQEDEPVQENEEATAKSESGTPSDLSLTQDNRSQLANESPESKTSTDPAQSPTCGMSEGSSTGEESMSSKSTKPEPSKGKTEIHKPTKKDFSQRDAPIHPPTPKRKSEKEDDSDSGFSNCTENSDCDERSDSWNEVESDPETPRRLRRLLGF